MQLGSRVMPEESELLTIGGIALDDRTKEVTLDGEKAALTPTEYDILKFLMKNPGKVYSPAQIYAAVWNGSPFGTENTVAVHISSNEMLCCLHGIPFINILINVF